MEEKLTGLSNLLLLICLICMTVLASACSGASDRQHTQTLQPTSIPTPGKPAEVPAVVVSEPLWIQSTDTYKEIIEKAGIIVVGKVTDTGWTFNAARNADNVQEPVETYMR